MNLASKINKTVRSIINHSYSTLTCSHQWQCIAGDHLLCCCPHIALLQLTANQLRFVRITVSRHRLSGSFCCLPLMANWQLSNHFSISYTANPLLIVQHCWTFYVYKKTFFCWTKKHSFVLTPKGKLLICFVVFAITNWIKLFFPIKVLAAVIISVKWSHNQSSITVF